MLQVWKRMFGRIIDECKVLFGLLICIFERVVGQCCFVASVFQHIVPCDQSLTNGCSPRLKALLERKKATMNIIICYTCSGFITDIRTITNHSFHIHHCDIHAAEMVRTHPQWVWEVRQVRHQDAYQSTYHNQHGAHPQDHHRPISYQLCIAGNIKETRLINSTKAVMTVNAAKMLTWNKCGVFLIMSSLQSDYVKLFLSCRSLT